MGCKGGVPSESTSWDWRFHVPRKIIITSHKYNSCLKKTHPSRLNRKHTPELWVKNASVPLAKPAITSPWEYLYIQEEFHQKPQEFNLLHRWHKLTGIQKILTSESEPPQKDRQTANSGAWSWRTNESAHCKRTTWADETHTAQTHKHSI